MTFRQFLSYEIIRAGGPDILADLVGVTVRTIRRWKSGALCPTAERVPILSAVTGVSEARIALMIHSAHKVHAIHTAFVAGRKPLARVLPPAFPVLPAHSEAC